MREGTYRGIAKSAEAVLSIEGGKGGEEAVLSTPETIGGAEIDRGGTILEKEEIEDTIEEMILVHSKETQEKRNEPSRKMEVLCRKEIW